ncbi:MAG: hypothetical protein AB9917_24160 [Negativicutes bacterium]
MRAPKRKGKECDGWFELLWDLSVTIEAEFVAIQSAQDSSDDGAPFAIQVDEATGNEIAARERFSGS